MKAICRESVSKVAPTLPLLRLLVFTLSTILLCGCPDYSHLRPVPDYENMADLSAE